MGTFHIETQRGRNLTIDAPDGDSALKLADQWDLEDHASSEATRLGLNPDRVLRQMHQESRGNPNAVSPKGARGPMQLMPDTAKELGVDPDDPYQNITGGVTYLKKQMDTFGGDERKALAAYNAGPGAVRRAGGVPNYPETQAYVASIMGEEAPKPKPPPLPGMMPQKAPQRATVAPAVDVGGDVKRGGLAGLKGGLAGLADTAIAASPIGLLQSYLKNVSNISSLMTGEGKTSMPGVSQPVSGVVARDSYVPKTLPGKLAKAGGTMLPNALIPASLMTRLASVGLPALGQVGGEAAGKAAGLDETGQQLAGAAGSMAGGLATGIRLPQRGTRLPRADLAALDKAQNEAWARVDASTFRLPKADAQAAAKDIRALVDDAGPELYENSAKYASRIEALANRGDLTLGQLNRLKSQMRAKLMGGDEVGVGGPMLDRVEALIDTAKDPVLKQAREAYKRFVKVRDVTERLESADLARTTSGTGGNSNAPAQKLKPLIDPKSPQRARNFTPEETAAVRKVVRGGAVENLLRLGSTFDPTAGKLRMGAFGFGASANPALALPVAAAGYISGRAKDALQAKNVDDMLALFAAGGSRPTPQPAPLAPYAFAPAFTAPLLATPAIAAPQRRKTSHR